MHFTRHIKRKGECVVMSKGTLKRLVSYINNYKAICVLCFVLAAINVLFTLLIPVIIGIAIDNIIAQQNVNFNVVFSLLLQIGAFAVAAAVSQWFLLFFTRKLSSFITRDITKQAYNTVNKMPFAKLDKYASGDIQSRLVNDANLVSEGILQGIVQLFPGVCTILGTLITMLVLNPIMTITVVLITPLSILFASFMAKRTSKYFKRQSEAQGALAAFINETLNAQSLIQNCQAQNAMFEKLDLLNEAARESGVKSTFYSSVINPGTRFVNAVAYAIVLIIGAIAVLRGALSVGQLSIFLTYANQYTKPFNEVSGVLTQMQSAIAGANRLFEIIDAEVENEMSEKQFANSKIEGSVQFENVCFSYSKKPFIENMNINVKSGEHIAIVGSTGCGKTTLINLLMRFYNLNSGEIYVDGIPISKISRNELRSNIGMVLQDTWLKNASVKENIAYSKVDATQEEIEKAAKAAYAHSFIKRLPNGYDTIIQSKAGNLSAGQRQLLCIARIMLCEPLILLLDEATSSIDTRTEMLIQKAFDKLMQGRTSFVVAHRLSTIKNADCILVMDNGKIIESGTHEFLIQQNGYYKNLYNSSFALS